MKSIKTLLLTTIITVILLSACAFAGEMAFITCDENGKAMGTQFSKATINVSSIDMSGNYLYYGIDICVYKKAIAGTEWQTLFQKRIPTNSLKIQIADFGESASYKNDEIYSLGYRVLYTMLDSEEGNVIETDWKRIDGGYFKIKGEGEVGITPVVETTPTTFSDVPKDYWAYDAIMAMYNKGVISGCDDGTFKPEDKVTREQFAKMLLLALGLPVNDVETPSLADSDKNYWACKYVESAKQYFNTYMGVKGRTFDGSSFATREDMVCALVKAKGYDNETVDTKRLPGIFKDAISLRTAKYVLIGYDKKLMQGYDDGTFKPKGFLTRAEAVTILYRAIK